jgi:hypothetical protein
MTVTHCIRFGFAGLLVLATLLPAAAADKVHLFILSGQSNMAGLNPDISFTPTLKKEFSKDTVIVIKDAVGGQPIRRWYKQWKPACGEVAKGNGDLYDRLMGKVRSEQPRISKERAEKLKALGYVQ